jgi:hypothetical protein
MQELNDTRMTFSSAIGESIVEDGSEYMDISFSLSPDGICLSTPRVNPQRQQRGVDTPAGDFEPTALEFATPNKEL